MELGVWGRQVLKRYRPLVRLARSTEREYRATRSRLSRGRLIRRYLATHEVGALHIGAYENPLPGWLNTDIEIRHPSVVYLDATKPFPLPSDSFDYVYGEHLIEHLTYPNGLAMLRECCRVLRPGGIVRLATPSLDVLVALFTPNKTEMQKRYIRFMSDTWLSHIGTSSEALVVNNTFRNWWHQFIYDRSTLQAAMETAGLTAVGAYAYGESDVSALRGLESHGRDHGSEGQAVAHYETMALEGTKPAARAAPSGPRR